MRIVKQLFIKSIFLLLLSLTSNTMAAQETQCPNTLNHDISSLDGKQQVNLCQHYLGKVVLIVNTASKCGFTPQYDDLEKLYEKYKAAGLVVLGFPSNDFGAQEPGNAKQIQAFCRLTYGVKFPMFEKSHASQQNASPVFRVLGNLAGEFPAWNFHKYLLDRRGNLIGSYKSRVTPLGGDLENAIRELL